MEMENKILVALITGEHIRQASFLPSFIGLLRPVNSLTTTVHGQSPASARNVIIRQAIEIDCTHIFFMDDDMVFPPETLNKLIVHDKDIVSALYLLRSFPHRPAFFDKAYEDGKCKFTPLTPDTKGLVKGVNAGLGACLIKVDVFKHMEQPWVRLGEIEKDGWCDDIGFFNRCRKAGYDVYCDLDAPVGHMTTITMWPEYFENAWHTNYKHLDGNVRIPQDVQTSEQIREQEELLQLK
jgi:GT2 family glycosyltransferase